MKKSLTVLLMIGGLALPGVAWADDDCFVPMTDWQPRKAVSKLASEKGWTVRRIKLDDGCYQIVGQDEQGRAMKATLHPATLRILEIEYRGREGKGHHDD
jgi:hypothetical protein